VEPSLFFFFFGHFGEKHTWPPPVRHPADISLLFLQILS
jgi:hypothetical protein